MPMTVYEHDHLLACLTPYDKRMLDVIESFNGVHISTIEELFPRKYLRKASLRKLDRLGLIVIVDSRIYRVREGC